MAETRTIRTVLELNAQRFNTAAASAASSAKGLQAELAAISDSQGKQRANFDRVSNTLLGVGAAAATGLGLATKAAMDWESAWAGVRKTVDGSEAELAVLEEGLRGLAKELPASHEEIAAVAEAAGQLGVAREDVVDFTRTMINLGETTNLSADEAATSIAQFTNVMGTSADDVDRLGSALVALGNDGASTEAEIMNMAQRLSGAGALVGASEQEVLGLSSALASVGINAEAGGGSLSRVLQKMNGEVLEGGEKLELFAETAGVSSDEFAAAWRESPTEALDMFLQGLNGVTESGGNAIGVLKDLGIRGTEETRALLSLAGAGDLLSESIDTANSSWDQNMALTAEAAERYKTTEAQLQLARNAIVDAGIDIGASVLPVLADVAGAVADVAGWFSALPEPVQSSVAQFGAIVGASGLVAGALLKAVPALSDTIGAFKQLRETSPATASALTNVGKAVGIAGAAFGAVSAISAYGNSLTDFTRGANEAADAALRLAEGDSSGVFTGLGDDAELAAASTAQLAGELDILANGHWYEGISNAEIGIRNAFGAGIATTEDYRDRLDEVGRSLAGLAETDAPAAADAFNTLWGQFGSTEEAGLNLLETMPALKDQLIGVANSAKLPTDDLTLLKLATGELVPVARDAAEGQSELGSATGDATGEVEEQVDALEELQGILEETANLLLGVRGSERDFYASVDEANKLLEENGRVLKENGDLRDEHSETGRASQAALDGIAESTLALTGRLVDQEAAAADVDAAMQEGRENFIRTAEAMGMGTEEAERLADELQLIPDFVATEVEVETEKAKEDLAHLNGIMTEGVPPVEVPVEADTSKAEQDVHIFGSQVGDVPTEPVIVSANTYWAESEIESFYAAMMDRDWTVDINGETVGAEEALGILVEEINAGEGYVMINGIPTDAETALAQLISHVNGSEGEITIDGDSYPANLKTDQAKRHADGTTGTIDVNADTYAAGVAIANLARDRTAWINVRARQVGTSIASFAANIGRADGGWLNEGLNAGGWVPGLYPGPGIDNVLWPVKSGLAGGGMAIQPLAGTEFVVNGHSAKQWGPALEAMNAGMSRSEVAALIGGGAKSGNVTYAPQFSGIGAHQAALEADARFKHLLRAEAVALPGG